MGYYAIVEFKMVLKQIGGIRLTKRELRKSRFLEQHQL